jgi:5'-nucleotidase (lipoprotein e(P4) family)
VGRCVERRKEAKATPGSVAFVTKVHTLGGKVALVSNRSAADCQATQDNLKADGFSFDSIACQTDPTVSDKNPRFAKVQETLKVMMWIGDNIADFPGLNQAARTDESKLADFGSRLIALPNPMYGSFLGNPRD